MPAGFSLLSNSSLKRFNKILVANNVLSYSLNISGSIGLLVFRGVEAVVNVLVVVVALLALRGVDGGGLILRAALFKTAVR